MCDVPRCSLRLQLRNLRLFLGRGPHPASQALVPCHGVRGLAQQLAGVPRGAGTAALEISCDNLQPHTIVEHLRLLPPALTSQSCVQLGRIKTLAFHVSLSRELCEPVGSASGRQGPSFRSRNPKMPHFKNSTLVGWKRGHHNLRSLGRPRLALKTCT